MLFDRSVMQEQTASKASYDSARNMLTFGFGIVGTPVAKTIGTVYQAGTDGFVTATAYSNAGGATSIQGYTDSANPPTTIVQANSESVSQYRGSVSFMVRKGEYYKANLSAGGDSGQIMFFTPIGA